MFSEIVVEAPNHDCDIVIKIGGKDLVLQLRPSNADLNYNGSLDIIFPQDNLITCWEGDDMKDAPAPNENRQHERIAKQIVAELPGDWE
jgi:hypothetical protein